MGLGIVCAGQGLQSADMFANLYSLPQLSDEFAELEKQMGFPVAPMIGLSDEQLFLNRFAQPLIATQAFMEWQSIARLIPEPVVFAGYSLGELTAYACAGAFDFHGLLNLANLRAQAMDEACAGTQCSLLGVTGITRENLQTLCAMSSCYIAIQNSVDHFVAGGLISDLMRITEMIQEKFPGVKLSPLKVDIASHTPLLKNGTEKFKKVLVEQEWKKFSAPVISSVRTQAVYSKEDACDTLSAQISQMIRFDKTIKIMYEMGADVILELGPGKSLSKIIANLHLPVKVRSFSDFLTHTGAADWINKRLVS